MGDFNQITTKLHRHGSVNHRVKTAHRFYLLTEHSRDFKVGYETQQLNVIEKVVSFNFNTNVEGCQGNVKKIYTGMNFPV